MSSPLSMLKKTRRTLLQDPFNEQWNKQKVLFRKDLLQECQAVQVADDSPDSHPLHSSHNLSNDVSTSKSKASLQQGPPPSDVGLMSAMMQRVTLLEQTVKSQSQKIEHKEKKLAVLEARLKAYEESVNAHCQSDRDELERRCEKMQKQVDKMEDLLSDYDLIWVRDGVNGDSDKSEQTESSHFWPSGASASRNFHMNFDLVLQRINELNVLAGEGESYVQTTATGAKLSTKAPIQLRLYSNGIVMFDGPFRSYQEESTQMCIQDLMDGYFPSELLERFPDGKPFEVHDMRHQEYPAKLPWDTFPGEGQTVCGKKFKSTNAVSSQPSDKKLSTDLFLSKFPKFVVKAGQVIDIRDSMRTRLQGSSDPQSSSVITIDTPLPQAVMDRSLASSSNSPQSAQAAITLKVKSEDGSHTYVVKMCLSETVGHLRSYLDKHRGAVVPDYDIISAHPQCCFDDDGLTLQSYGLSTNATLLMRKKQK
ncbi:UBX domain-containing protein 11 [Melanotaenia boesemani]|uniref:UBX domain-containing protein 11 n=1 Tax=Melanotaenia boesemani TaxID=1250792 RepID=UPI001C03DFFB|nr:UBX domain-containing protein 11 [Melanotaenia boesemani]